MTHSYLRVYACGGTGSNVVRTFKKKRQALLESEDDKVSYSFFDTSKANTTDGADEQRYILDCDGSGSIRAQNYEQITDRILDALQENPPSEMNVVVFSTSGGSGSVFGPTLVKELISNNHPTIVLAVGGIETTKAVDNTRKTLATLDNLAEKILKAPVVMHYRCNQDSSLQQVDAEMVRALTLIEMIAAREARSLDGADIRNWLRYNAVSDVQPRLSSLEVYNDDTAPKFIKSAISVVTLASTHDDSMSLGIPAEYHRFGVQDLPSDNTKAVHYVVDQAPVLDVFKRVKQRHEDLMAQAKARPKITDRLDDSEGDANGFIL